MAQVLENHKHSECSLHPMVMGMITELKEDKKEMEATQLVLMENVVKITENLQEVQRGCHKTDSVLHELRMYNAKQDGEIQKNSMFVMKVLCIVGTVSFIASLSPLLIWLFGK